MIIECLIALTLQGQISIDSPPEGKEALLSALSGNCAWLPIIRDVLDRPAGRYHSRWQQYKRYGYQSCEGYSLNRFSRKEIRNMEQLAEQYGVPL